MRFSDLGFFRSNNGKSNAGSATGPEPGFDASRKEASSWCKVCASIDIQKLAAAKTGDFHHKRLKVLERSAETCPGCSLFWALSPKIDNIDKSRSVVIKYSFQLYSDVPSSEAYHASHGLSDVEVRFPLLRKEIEKDYRPMGLDVVANKESLLAKRGLVAGRYIAAPYDRDMPSLWLKTCLRCHHGCRLENSDNSEDDLQLPMPSRVIDVGEAERTDVLRLIEPESVLGAYSALTYRWGNGKIVKTLLSTLKVHQSEIDWNSMNQTYRDAVIMTQKLGLRYLWIDSICIIQDDRDDWERESKKMAQIYRNAVVTLSAARSFSTDDSLFPPRRSWAEQLFPRDGSHDESFVLSTRHWRLAGFTDDVENGALSKRGWTMQERLLSRRLLHFGKDQLHWECQSTIWSESTYLLPVKSIYSNSASAFRSSIVSGLSRSTSPSHVTSRSDEHEGTVFRMGQLSRELDGEDTGNNTSKRRKPLVPDSNGNDQSSEVLTLGQGWLRIVSAYSKRAITEPSDKLPAITGIMLYFKDELLMEFAWGMPKLGPMHSLLWSVAKGIRILPERCPSWSWASVDGDITFHVKELSGHTTAVATDFRMEERTCSFLAPILSCTLREVDHYDFLRHKCNVKIMAKKHNIFGYGSIDTDPNQTLPGAAESHANISLSKTLVGSGDWSCSSVVWISTALLYRQHEHLAKSPLESDNPGPFGYCLLLRSVEGKEGVYQRIGYAKAEDWHYFDDEPVKRINIV